MSDAQNELQKSMESGNRIINSIKSALMAGMETAADRMQAEMEMVKVMQKFETSKMLFEHIQVEVQSIESKLAELSKDDKRLTERRLHEHQLTLLDNQTKSLMIGIGIPAEKAEDAVSRIGS